MSYQAWEAALTEMENELNEHEEALRTGNVSLLPEFEPPADLGPLPEPLHDRVAQLARRVGLLATLVQYHLVATENDLHHYQNHTPTHGMALYLDASA